MAVRCRSDERIAVVPAADRIAVVHTVAAGAAPADKAYSHQDVHSAAAGYFARTVAALLVAVAPDPPVLAALVQKHLTCDGSTFAGCSRLGRRDRAGRMVLQARYLGYLNCFSSC